MSTESTDSTASTELDRPSRTLSFRPDIQGIRAVAVLLVVVNHVVPGRLTGGFVGVDVFFVVSGYLITALLLREAGRDHRISLGGFYARRARRIVPAATVVIVATAVVSVLTLPLLRAQEILSDAWWASLFAANIRMAEVGTDYFAQGQAPSPLRHYWSLAVEEQFYLVWPAVLVVVLVLVRRRVAAGRPHADGDQRGADRTRVDQARVDRGFATAAAVLIGLVIVGSLAWSVYTTYHSPVTAYYSSFARAFELGIGAACALAARRGALPARVRQVLGLAGLVALAAAVVLLDEQTPFPSGYALVPVLATAALVLAGEGDRPTVAGRLLSWRPAQHVGDWSYSIYLWHWPVIVLTRSNIGGERFNTVPVQLAVLVGVVALGAVSYRLLEQPFRTGMWKRRGRALAIYPVSIAMVVATAVVGQQVVRYQLGEFSDEPSISTADYAAAQLDADPYVALVEASVLAARDGRPVPGDLVPGLAGLRSQTASLGDCDYRTGTRALCPVGDPDAERSIVVLGDSRARAISPAIEKIGEEHGYRVYVLVYSGCSATALEQVDRTTGRVWDDCQDFKAWALDTVAELQPDLTVVTTSVGQVIDPSDGSTQTGGRDFDRYLALLDDGWRTLFTELRADSGRVVVVGNTPKLPRETGVCLSQGSPDLGDCAFEPGPAAEREAKTSFDAAEAVGVDRVNAKKWFCADGLCPSVVGRFITMRDSEHVTPDYARWLATPLAEALGVDD